MKRLVIMILVAIMMTSTVNAIPKDEVITSKNSKELKAKVYSIERNGKYYDITVKIVQSGKWKNNLYTIRLTSRDMKNWRAEEGKIVKGMKVWAWLYKNHTKTIYDDEFFHIRKR